MVLATGTSGDVDLTQPSTVVDRLSQAVEELLGAFVAQLPLFGLAVVVLVLGLVVSGLAVRGVRRATAGDRVDPSLATLLTQVARVLLVLLAILMALSVAGVDVGSALAALGIAGLAVAFAVQSILENFIAGVLILVRRPFRPGDQIRTGDFEGTVEDVNLRVTRLRDYDGELVLVPNAQVLGAPIVNLTERGLRRSRVAVGVDYRDDHDAAREVIRDAVATVDGVLPEPAPEVLMTELGESSVDFELRYWTAPDIRSVVHVRDRVLSSVKTGLEAAGMTIPWPIRTLVVDPDSAPLAGRAGHEEA